MTKDLRNGIIAAMKNEASANFSAEDVNTAAINAIMSECGLNENSTAREIRAKEDLAFALIEESIDEILPAKIQAIMQDFAEIKTFARDAEVVFNIEKVGKKRAKLTIAKGARGGVYRAARLDSKYFAPKTEVYTVAVYVTLEELILGTASLAELYANVLEGMEEIIYKEVFNALVSSTGISGYEKIIDSYESGSGSGYYNAQRNIEVAKADLHTALDKVMPYVKQYGVPTIFGSFTALTGLQNDSIGENMIPDVLDVRGVGFIKQYKGIQVVELPNYLVDETNTTWFYNNLDSYVFVIPAGAKPVKVALKGELYMKRNEQAVGSEKWEAHKIMGVGLAMANNFAVIKLN